MNRTGMLIRLLSSFCYSSTAFLKSIKPWTYIVQFIHLHFLAYFWPWRRRRSIAQGGLTKFSFPRPWHAIYAVPTRSTYYFIFQPYLRRPGFDSSKIIHFSPEKNFLAGWVDFKRPSFTPPPPFLFLLSRIGNILVCMRAYLLAKRIANTRCVRSWVRA